jgi:hypothetical protein
MLIDQTLALKHPDMDSENTNKSIVSVETS